MLAGTTIRFINAGFHLRPNKTTNAVNRQRKNIKLNYKMKDLLGNVSLTNVISN